MKIDRRHRENRSRYRRAGLAAACAALLMGGWIAGAGRTRAEGELAVTPAVASQVESSAGARELVERVIESLAHGPAFDAKVRQRVWTSDREIVGVGTYEQAGGGSGRFNLQLSMHDGDGKHTLQQISDGRLAWTRSEVAGGIALKRVDVGRLGEWVLQRETPGIVSPRLRVGAWTELLDTIARDYVLRLSAGRLENQAVWILSGTIRQAVQERVVSASGRTQWPALYPTQVRVAIAATAVEGTEFGEGLPVRIEFWSDRSAVLVAAQPSTTQPSTTQPSTTQPSTEAPEPEASAANPQAGEAERAHAPSRLITLIELYSIRPIDAPPVARFRFENQDAEVNFTNETDRYLERYGVELTERDRRQLRR